MEGRDLVTMDKELLLQVVQNMRYGDVLRWCNSNPRFKNLCLKDPTFFEGVIQKKEIEEGFAKITLEAEDDMFIIMMYIIQDSIDIDLMMSKPRVVELLGNLEDGNNVTLITQNEITMDVSRVGMYEYVDQYNIAFGSGGMRYTMFVSEFIKILKIVLEMYEKGFDLDGEVEGHVVLMLDGTSEFIPH